jgi:branched-chain amino acid transport system ATP-binding protein
MATPSSSLPPVLEVFKLSKRFRGLLALQDVDLTLRPGTIHGVIGPNGAGKTTFFNCLTGQYTPTQGKILFKGQDITRKPAPAIARLGIARTFQNIRLFGGLSVLDNVRVAQQLRTSFSLPEVLLSLPSFHRKEKLLTDQAMSHLELFGLADVADRQATGLPYGTQRRLEIARALATGPELLLLDEPAAGMNASETDALHQMILEVQRRFNLAIILVEHDMRLVMNMCNQITVLSYGRVLAEGAPEVIRQNTQVIESYLGTTKHKAPKTSPPGKEANR